MRSDRVRRGAVAALCMLVLGARCAAAQQDGDRWMSPATFGQRIGVVAGGAWANPSISSPTKRRPMALLALRASWLLTGSRENGVEYVVQVPAVVVRTSPAYFDVGVDGFGTRTTTPLGTAFGLGLEPIGFRGLVGVARRVRLVADASGGILLFSERVPVASARRFNFVYSFGAGTEIDLGRGRTFTAGYRLLHYSNAFSAVSNPGVDNGVVFAGLLFSRGR